MDERSLKDRSLKDHSLKDHCIVNGINEKINRLPEDVVNIIYDFIPKTALLFTNKFYYTLYHKALRSSIKKYETYIRDVIRRDNDFVFHKIVEENINRWLNMRQYRYKNKVFSNYFYFVIDYCIENDSDKCREIMADLIKERQLCKNLHKKNVVKYVRWTK